MTQIHKKLLSKRLDWLQSLLVTTIAFLFCTPTHAQITPDNTIGRETSTIAPNNSINGINTDIINGGAIRGGNLFHSFSQFNLSDGQRVYFGNPSGVENILTRVTGGQASNILGTLGVNGAANLFIINPNGIVFGKNASLDVRGSFVATTANGIGFGNQGNFNATNPEVPPLLTVNPSALLFNQINPGAITNQSQANAGMSPVGNVTGLRVADSQSLLLIGGNINFDNGNALAYGGNIELISLAALGNVGLNFINNIPIAIPDNIIELGDISLRNGSQINVIGMNKGSIKIDAQNLYLSEGSKLIAGIDTDVDTASRKGGDILINTTGTTTLTDTSTISNLAINGAIAKAGDININSDSLIMKGGGITVGSLGEGDGGNININVKNAVSISNQNNIIGTINSILGLEEIGDGGNININAGSVTLNLGLIFTSSFAKNISGNLSLDETQQVLDLVNRVNGNTGNIQISADDNVILSGDSGILTTNIGNGNAGKVEINAGKNITIKNSSVIQTNTVGKGNAGNITLIAKDKIDLDGLSSDSSLAPTLKQTLSAGVSPSVAPFGLTGKGQGGNINITAPHLWVSNGATLSVSNAGEGEKAGSININTDTVRLDKKGKKGFIAAITFSGEGGNININAKDFLLLKDGSNISTVAGLNQLQGDGGNININTPFIIATPKGNSNITSDSFIGKGGKINIRALSLFGITPQPQEFFGSSDNSNSITASSQSGIKGEINVTQLEAQPTQSIIELPSQLVDVSSQIGQICPTLVTNRHLSQFIITGRGSLPPSPLETLPGNNGIKTLATLDRETNITSKIKNTLVQPIADKPVIVEAQGWVKNRDGSIILVSQTSHSQTKRTSTPTCKNLEGLGWRY